jgi:hypothetical protein
VSVRALVAETWQIYRGRAFPLLGIAALPIVPLDIAGGIFDPTYDTVAPNWTAFGVSVIILYVVATPLATGAIVAYLDDERSGSASIGAAFGRIDRLGTLAIATLLYNIATLATLLLLIVPGLLVGARWALYVPAIVFERTSASGALRRSNALVRGHTWTVVGVGLLTGLIALALVIVPVVIASLSDSVYGAILVGVAIDLGFVPPFAVAAYVVYRRLLEEA